MDRNGSSTEAESWRGTIFQTPGIRVDCYRLQLTTGSGHDDAVGVLAEQLERIGLSAIARWLRNGARTRDLALAYRTARRLRSDPRFAQTAIRVCVSKGTVWIEGRFTPAQSALFAHVVHGAQRARRLSAAIRVARIATSRE